MSRGTSQVPQIDLRNRRFAKRKAVHLLLPFWAGLALSGCAGFGASGPSAGKIAQEGGAPLAASNIQLVDLTESVLPRLQNASSAEQFSRILAPARPIGVVLGAGDAVDVTIWEAPPAVLFGATTDTRASLSNQSARSTTMPEQMIDASGRLTIPFAGSVQAAGRTPRQVEEMIASRLQGKANQPQVVVRLVRNATANVTVVGEVSNSTRLALTPKGERLLDAIAAAGGVRQPVSKTMVQITRKDRVVAMPLETVIKDPAQNIVLSADDVVTAYYQPFSFTALGAIANNAEIPFEATGITLAQALGRIGGLNDDKANARGVFIFRLEEPAALAESRGTVPTTPDGKVPVIYRINLKDPKSFFLAQGFPIRNKDVLFVSNAPVADLQKFMNIVSSMTFSVVGVANAL